MILQFRNFIPKPQPWQQQWVKFNGNSSYDNPGFSEIIATIDSCICLRGNTYGETGGGYDPYDSWILKIDNDGNKMGQKTQRINL